VRFDTSGAAKSVLREDFLGRLSFFVATVSFCTYFVKRLRERLPSGGTARIRPHFSFPLCAFDV
jgi:hypothetical protein